MIELRIIATTTYVSTLPDEDEKKVREYYENNQEEYENMDEDEALQEIVDKLYWDYKLNIYNENTYEEDSSVEEITVEVY